MNKESDSAFTVNVRCVSRLLHKCSVVLYNDQLWLSLVLLLRLHALVFFVVVEVSLFLFGIET